MEKNSNLLQRIEALEIKVLGGLLNFSEASNYLNVSPFWLKFLIDKNLIKLTFIPGYTKPKIYKKHLDEFIEEMHSNRNLYVKIFITANEISLKRFATFEDKSNDN
ncbi:MAG: hypothetical protein IPH62_15455 [Ignavibacteriae bacterium]|nr:hypothetical protein [Ignavibacteriota bacterium]